YRRRYHLDRSRRTKLSRGARPMISNVVHQHSDAASVLWSRRDRAVGEPHYHLRDLVKLDDRLEAQLEGLRIAGNDGWLVCLEELQRWRDSGSAFTAAVLAWESANANRVQLVLSFAEQSVECYRAIASSLAWVGDDLANPIIAEFLGGKE